MPRLRQVRNKEEGDAVPVDQPVQVDLSSQDTPPTGGDNDGQQAQEAQKEPKKERAAKPVVVAEEDTGETEALTALQKQIEDLKKANKLQEEAHRDALRQIQEENKRTKRESNERVNKYQTEAEEAQYEAVLNARVAAEADVEAAQRALEMAEEAGDPKAKARAMRDLSVAAARIAPLDDAKLTLERMREERKNAKPTPEQPTDDERFEAAISQMPANAKSWLRNHPEFVKDASKNADLRYYHETVLRSGVTFDTPAYYESLETHLGLRAKTEIPEGDNIDDDEIIVETKPKRRVVSQAPPSRDVPSSGTGERSSPTRVTLSPEERALARSLNLTDVQYAEQKLKLQELKKNGHYQER